MRRNGGKAYLGRLFQAEPFIVAKDEKLLFKNRQAYRPAKLISVEARFGLAATAKEVLGIQIGVAIELEGAAMNIVCARLYRGDYQGAARAAKFRWGHAGLHPEFLNGIRWREEDDGIDQGFVVVNPVEDEVIGLRTKPVYRQRGSALLSESECFRVIVDAGGGVCAGRHPAACTRHEGGQLSEVATV